MAEPWSRRPSGGPRAGFRVARNAPYAGGHITERHGRPADGIHALQLEIDRSLYLAPDLRTTGPGFDRVARLIAAIAEALAVGEQAARADDDVDPVGEGRGELQDQRPSAALP
jgi:hypothetical protein